MDLNVSELGEKLLAAASQSLGTSWSKAKGVVEPQLKDLARIAADLGERAAKGRLTEAEAKALFGIHVNTTKTVMLTVEGLGILAAEAAVNAVLGVVRTEVNTVLGFNLA